MGDSPKHAAYGGPGWSPRTTNLREELGSLWASCGLDSEWGTLRSVLLHRPGPELETAGEDPEGNLLLGNPRLDLLQRQHDALALAFAEQDVEVRYVNPPALPTPNQLFSADLMAMTPEGAIVGRPASRARAGEERWMARALAEAGIPIRRSVGGSGTFEGADLMWVGPGRTLLAQGLRTNAEGAAQVSASLTEMGVEVHSTHLPSGTMHLMGQLRIVDQNLAFAWPRRLPDSAANLLEGFGLAVHFIPDEEEARTGFALNHVTLSPRRILLPAGNPKSQAFFEAHGVECVPVEVSEIGKAAGSIGCLTGIVEREIIGA